jgi:hypothetical protein
MRFMVIRKADAQTEAEFELRPLYEAEDFGDEFTPDMRKHEEMLREQARKNG